MKGYARKGHKECQGGAENTIEKESHARGKCQTVNGRKVPDREVGREKCHTGREGVQCQRGGEHSAKGGGRSAKEGVALR